MRLGHCKHCRWHHGGKCYMQGVSTDDSSYCPDYLNRAKGNKEDGRIEDWINKHPEINILD